MNRNVSIASGLFLLLGGTASAQVTERVSVGPAGAQGNDLSIYPTLSSDGRYVAFSSAATNLVAGDTNGTVDVFARDRVLGTTELVSVDSAGTQGIAYSGGPAVCISADGRYVAFASTAWNLVAGDTNATQDIFVRDRQLGTTERVSVSSAGAQADGYNGWSFLSISADGRYVAFASSATNLVAGDTNGAIDVFLRDRQLGTTERVSVDSSGSQEDSDASYPWVTPDGRYVAFSSDASNLVAGDTNGTPDVFVRDRQLGTTERVSVGSGGSQANGFSYAPSISADGRFVAFYSDAPDLVPGDTNGWGDIFLRDRQLGTTTRISVSSAGVQGNGNCAFPSISADGRYVAFNSYSTNLVAGDTNGQGDAFLRDVLLGTTERVSVGATGQQGNNLCFSCSISADGRRVAFQSDASNLVDGDTNAVRDVFVRDLAGGPSFTSLCHPGLDGVIGCPCANPPSSAGRGCDNSSATGGAILSGAGSASLSSDTLVLSTTGQKPATASVLVQGTASIAGGVVYGQGVRCVGGALVRLYTTGATNGGVSLPDAVAGDPPVSVRSASLGDAIQAGESRWYLVLYRDATVVGSCPATSVFNTTQTGEVAWSP